MFLVSASPVRSVLLEANRCNFLDGTETLGVLWPVDRQCMHAAGNACARLRATCAFVRSEVRGQAWQYGGYELLQSSMKSTGRRREEDQENNAAGCDCPENVLDEAGRSFAPVAQVFCTFPFLEIEG